MANADLLDLLRDVDGHLGVLCWDGSALRLRVKDAGRFPKALATRLAEARLALTREARLREALRVEADRIVSLGDSRAISLSDADVVSTHLEFVGWVAIRSGALGGETVIIADDRVSAQLRPMELAEVVVYDRAEWDALVGLDGRTLVILHEAKRLGGGRIESRAMPGELFPTVAVVGSAGQVLAERGAA